MAAAFSTSGSAYTMQSLDYFDPATTVAAHSASQSTLADRKSVV